MMDEFRAALDEATQTKLRARLRQKPTLTLAEFKHELRVEFGIDAQRQCRRDWESVQQISVGSQGNEITLKNFGKFKAQFELYRESVPERSAGEEWRTIFSKLPREWQRQVQREQAKIRERRPWVRVTYPPDVDPNDVLVALEDAWQEELPYHRECASGFIFETLTEDERRRFLRFNRSPRGDHFLGVSQHEYEMTGDELFEFINKRLRVDEEFRVNHETLGCGQGPTSKTARAQVVEADVAAMQVVQFTPGRGHSSSQSSKSFS